MKKIKEPKCKNCWDKGYSTELMAIKIHVDFPGDKEYKKTEKVINFCKCERGKELKEYFQMEKEKLMKKYSTECCKILREEKSQLAKEIKHKYQKRLLKILKTNI